MSSDQSLYLECSAGISGDMVVAALLDVGADQKKLISVLESLPVPGFAVEISHVKKAGLDACDFNVVLDAEHETRDHDMEYLYGHAHDDATLHRHGHAHRDMAAIGAIIDASTATPGAKKLAKRIFEVLAQAEAKAHGVPVEEVHFHEVGAVDSIVDILSAAVCLDDLAPCQVIVPKLCEGQGTVRCQHGILPVPVPAVVNIAAACNIALTILDVQGELVTPTGAAIVAAARTGARLPETFTVMRVGLGAGKRAYPETSGLLRAFLISPE